MMSTNPLVLFLSLIKVQTWNLSEGTVEIVPLAWKKGLASTGQLLQTFLILLQPEKESR